MTYQELKPYRDAIVLGAQTLPPAVAEKVPMLYDPWDGDKHEYKEGNRFVWGDPLIVWEARKDHKSQPDWTPDVATSLYKKVADGDQGDTPDNPIPYDGNMELFEGKYYTQSDVVYYCFRSTGQPVYHNLADLVGHYVEVYNGGER